MYTLGECLNIHLVAFILNKSSPSVLLYLLLFPPPSHRKERARARVTQDGTFLTRVALAHR